MYNSSSFKCQLSFNWHLNLNKVCATQSWCQHQDNGFEVTMVTVTLRSQTSHLHGDSWSDFVWYYIMKKILKRKMKYNHQNRCKNKDSTFKNRKHILCTLEPLFYLWISVRKNIDYVEDYRMNIPTHWPSEVNGQRRLRTTGANREVMG